MHDRGGGRRARRVDRLLASSPSSRSSSCSTSAGARTRSRSTSTTRSIPRQAAPRRHEPVPRPARRPQPRANYIWPPFVGYVVAPLTLLPATAADYHGGDPQPDRVRRRPVDRRCARLARLRRLVPLAPGDRRDANGAPDARPLPPPRGGLAHARPIPVRRPHARRRARAQVLPLAARDLARRAAAMARRRARGRLRRSPRSCSCCRSSRCPSTRGSCAGSGRPSTRTASLRSACSPSWARPIASRRRSRIALGIAVLVIAWRLRELRRSSSPRR